MDVSGLSMLHRAHRKQDAVCQPLMFKAPASWFAVGVQEARTEALDNLVHVVIEAEVLCRLEATTQRGHGYPVLKRFFQLHALARSDMSVFSDIVHGGC